jgi:hypothetical protein
MFIRVPLKPTFFTKSQRSLLLNIKEINKIYIQNKTIELYPHPHNLLFSPFPTKITFETKEKANKIIESIESQILNAKDTKTKGNERMDMASPDSLAIAALEEYENEIKENNKNLKQLH